MQLVYEAGGDVRELKEKIDEADAGPWYLTESIVMLEEAIKSLEDVWTNLGRKIEELYTMNNLPEMIKRYKGLGGTWPLERAS